MYRILSVNVGRPRANAFKDTRMTGFDKEPAAGAVRLSAPGPKGVGERASGLEGDAICDRRNHGGDDQAVYAYAREDLDGWERRLGRPLPPGVSFGENLTTAGIDVNGALIGERWRIGGPGGPLLEVSGPRIPCATFAGRMGERGWVKTFVRAAEPGAYLRVAEPGEVSAGDPVEIEHRPAHTVTVALVMRALTLEPDLLPRLLEAPELPEEARDMARRRIVFPMG